MPQKKILNVPLNRVEGGQSLELLVTDNGPGIEAEIREDLFSPFKTTKEGGTGLGLSTVARIASSHGGHAKAEDAPGGGSIFRVRWPFKTDPEIPFSDLRYSQNETSSSVRTAPTPGAEEVLVLQ